MLSENMKITVALIQSRVTENKEENINKHVLMIKQAAANGAKIICLQELFYTTYFAFEQDKRWFSVFETIPGPTTEIMQRVAEECNAVLIVPLPEIEMPGLHYNSAVVIDADGKILGKYRKIHLPQMEGFYEKFYFRTGNLGYPVFETAYGKIGILIDYDRNYPEAARILALKGAQILFNPCTTIMDLSRYVWFIVQRSHAILNGVFMGTINRVGIEPGNPGLFYGTSYICDPTGEVIAQGSQDSDEIVIADLDLSLIKSERNRWNYFRDRQPSTYVELIKNGP